MSAPQLTISVEPVESGATVYGPLAANTANDKPQGQLSLVLKITNNESKQVHVKKVELKYSSPPAVNTATIAADVTIDAGKSKSWYFAAGDNQILPVAAPATVTISLYCDNFTDPAKTTQKLAAYVPPGGGYLFPARADDLREGEYWQGRSAVHGAAGGGVQLFAYDLAVVAYNDDAWSELLPDGSKSKNEDYRIWSKPVYAMADGTVVDFANDYETNPNPPDDLSPPNPVEGNHFYLQHGADLVLYAHFQKGTLTPAFLQKGAVVHAGDKLGLAGNSGNSSNPHLHIHAIRGTEPWKGPPHPLAFRDIHVIERAALSPPNPQGPWVAVAGQCIPAERSLIWPAAVLPPRFWLRRFFEVAVDPLSLILSSAVYVKLTLPDPPPIEVFTRQLHDYVRALAPEQRRAALVKLKTLDPYLNAMEKELSQH